MIHNTFFFFFFDIPSSLLLRIDYHQMLSFQESVGHITCTLWSSPQLSTIYEFLFVVLIVSSCFFLGDHVAIDQLPLPLGGCGILRHLRGLRPLQVKTISWGRIHNIYSSSGEVKNGIYGWPVISQTRSCVGGSPCSLGGEPGSFWCGKPPRE